MKSLANILDEFMQEQSSSTHTRFGSSFVQALVNRALQWLWQYQLHRHQAAFEQAEAAPVVARIEERRSAIVNGRQLIDDEPIVGLSVNGYAFRGQKR